MTIFDVDIEALTPGSAGSDRYRGSALLVVNVASRCDMTPRYGALHQPWDAYPERGLVAAESRPAH